MYRSMYVHLDRLNMKKKAENSLISIPFINIDGKI